MREYLRRFDRVNLCVGKWSIREARERAASIAVAGALPGGARQALILLGSKVCSAFALPKLTHLLNDGAALKHFGFTFEKTHAEHVRQFGMMRAEYPQADALDLFEQTIAHCVAVWGIDR